MRELTPGQVFAGYVIQRRLGAGGMGAVYLARHPRLPRFDALKLLAPALTAQGFSCPVSAGGRPRRPA